MATSINEFEQVQGNLYKNNGMYFRLFAKGETPNGCWLIAPIMRELLDIDVSTGNDVYGSIEWAFDVTGTVSTGRSFIRY